MAEVLDYASNVLTPITEGAAISTAMTRTGQYGCVNRVTIAFVYAVGGERNG